MNLRRLPPVWSPLTLTAVFGGVRAGWLGSGRRARQEVERLLRAAYGPDALFLTDSGTSALTLAITAARSVSPTPIALPAYCCYDVATAAIGADAPFFLYDLDPGTLSPDLASLRLALEGGAGTVVVAHLYGVPMDFAAVEALAAEFGALIVEDAAQASGCSWKGKPAGSHGAMGVLSFGRGKGITGGGGGALLINDRRFARSADPSQVASRGHHAPARGSLGEVIRLAAQWALGRPSLYRIPASLPFLGLGTTPYRAPHPTGGLSPVAAGVLAHTLDYASAEVGLRRANAARLRNEIRGVAHIQVPDGWEAGWLRLPVVLPRTAGGVLTRHHAALGVMPGYPVALPDLPGFGERRLNRERKFAGARLLAERLVTIPTHRFVRSATVPVF